MATAISESAAMASAERRNHPVAGASARNAAPIPQLAMKRPA